MTELVSWYLRSHLLSHIYHQPFRRVTEYDALLRLGQVRVEFQSYWTLYVHRGKCDCFVAYKYIANSSKRQDISLQKVKCCNVSLSNFSLWSQENRYRFQIKLFKVILVYRHPRPPELNLSDCLQSIWPLQPDRQASQISSHSGPKICQNRLLHWWLLFDWLEQSSNQNSQTRFPMYT